MSTNTKKGSGSSDHDNEVAGRLLIVGAFFVVGILFLAVSPILITGLLMGLVWYGGTIRDDNDSDWQGAVIPIIISIVSLLFLVGFPPPFSDAFRGLLFTDFEKWTVDHIWGVVKLFNQILPRKYEVRHFTYSAVQAFAWSVIPVAAAFFGYLLVKGSGKGRFLYDGISALFMPLRMALLYPLWVSVTLSGVSLVFDWLGFPTLASELLILAFGAVIYAWLSTRNSNRGQSKENDAGKVSAGVTLGFEKGKSGNRVALTPDAMNHHVHIVGASGFGKSVLLSHLIKAKIQSGSGLLYVDLKADFESIRQVVSIAKSVDRIDDLQIFSISSPEISQRYNVIGRGSANQLKDRLMGALEWSEEFYKNEAQSFLLKLLRGLTYLRDHQNRDFDLSDVLRCVGDSKEILSLSSLIPESDAAAKSELEALSGYLAKPDNQRNLQGLKAQLESLLLSEFGHLLGTNKNGIDLFKAISEKKVVFVLLDSRTYGESSRAIGKLILQDLKAVSARIDSEIPREARKPFQVIIDEFADMASDDFISFLDRARSSKIGVCVAHQEIADLEKVSPEFAPRLMNSTSTLFSFLQKLPDSSELISGIAGTRKTKEVTEQAQSRWLLGDEMTGMKSIKEVDEFVIHPNVIRSLAVGECVMVQKYPKSRALVMKVRPESKDGYISDDQTKWILRSLVIKKSEDEVSRFKTLTPPPPADLRPKAGRPAAVLRKPERLDAEDKYWDSNA